MPAEFAAHRELLVLLITALARIPNSKRLWIDQILLESSAPRLPHTACSGAVLLPVIKSAT